MACMHAKDGIPKKGISVGSAIEEDSNGKGVDHV